MRAPSPSRQCSFYPTTPYILSNLSHYASVYNPSPSSLTDSQKRQKLQEFDSGFIDYESPIDYALPYNSVPQSSTRNIHLNPHISLQRAHGPASPTTLSTRSPPSPSRSRVAVMSTEQSPQDFQLYDDGTHISADHHQKQQVNRRYDSVHSFEHRSSPTPNSRFGSGFPTTVPHSESHTSRPGLPYYSTFRPDNNDFSKPPAQQQHQYLQALPQFRNQGSNMVQMIQTQHHGSDDEDPPALSPHTQSQFSVSSRPSLSDVDLHSPATPIASPGPSDGADGCGAPVPAVSEDTSYLEAWMEHYLRSESDIRTPTPKLGRTISDAFQDELFNPGIAPGTSITSQSMQDSNNMNSKLPKFLHQAQTQHSMARATPPTTRGHSPFRANSPFHPAAARTNQFPLPQSPSRTTSLLPVGFGTARAQREQEAEREAELLSQQIQQGFGPGGEAPKTISPKDAYVDYCEPEEEDVKGSLFPQDDAYSQDGSAHGGSYKGSIHSDDDVQSDHSFGIKTEESFGSMATSRRESDVSMNLNPQLYAGNGNQQYAQICFPYTYSGSDPVSQASVPEEEHDYDYNPASSPNSKPAESRANGGVYTCTVPGCTKRFPTTTKMSKHRREAHRQTTPLSSIKSHHPGPHKCTRINPTTNKPCNTIFSRPYDLTRHEDTIHNTNRQKVRCEICNDEKTFSRQDALTRHKKVKHGIDK